MATASESAPPVATEPAPPSVASGPYASGGMADLADDLLLFARRRRITVELYDKMTELGLLTPEDRVELIEGVIVEKMTKNPPHIVATELLGHVLPRLVPEGWYVSSGNPVTLAQSDSEPEPDTQVVRGNPRDYLQRKHGPADAALVVEVSDSSYTFDRRIKWRLYAAEGVPLFWLLDVNRRVLEVHSDPAPEGYRATQTLGPNDEAALVLDGREVARLRVLDVLP